MQNQMIELDIQIKMKRLYFLVFLMIGMFCLGNCKVAQIIQVFRHGVRYNSFIAKGDFSEIAAKLRSRGQLSSEGKNMQYVLGQQLRKKYWNDLFGNTPNERVYNQSKFYVRSTDFNRTIESAQCQMLGWLETLDAVTLTPKSFKYSLPPLKGLKKTIPTLPWYVFGYSAKIFHPIPVHIVRYGVTPFDKGEFLLSTDAQNCPNQDIWIPANYLSSFAKQIESHPDVVSAKSALEKQLGYTVDMWSVYRYFDNSVSLRYLNLPYLKVFDNPEYTQTFEFINLISFMFRNFHTQDQLKTGTSDLLKEMLNRIKRYIKDPETEQLILYSGHDSSVMQIPAALGYFDSKCIFDKFKNRKSKPNTYGPYNTETSANKCFTQMAGFAANLVVQLIKEKEAYFVKVLYNGQNLKLSFCGDKDVCSFESFQSWVGTFTLPDVQKSCGVK